MQIYVRSGTPARGFANPLEDPRISGALARKRGDATKKSTVEYGAFGPKVASFLSGRRGPASDLPPGRWAGSRFMRPSLWKGCSIGRPYLFFPEAKAQGWTDLYVPADTRAAVSTQHTRTLFRFIV